MADRRRCQAGTQLIRMGVTFHPYDCETSHIGHMRNIFVDFFILMFKVLL
jgi:hypothetical protein